MIINQLHGFTLLNKINCKKLDQEPSPAKSRIPLKNHYTHEQSGLYYYGARYYNPTISTWLVVDPLASEFQSLTPYHFSANNPIMIVDYDGRDTSFADDNARKLYKTTRENVVNQIDALKAELNNTKKGSRKHGRINNSINNYEKLLNDFQEIEKSSTPMVHYSIDDSKLKENENGLTVTGAEGPIQIFLRAGHNEAIIHENRHANQIFDNGIGKFNYTIEKEVEAFEYQRIYSPSSVKRFIDISFNNQYIELMANPNNKSLLDNKRRNFKLIDAIKANHPEFN